MEFFLSTKLFNTAVQKTLVYAIIILTSAVMISWVIHYESLLFVISNGASMKFNSALLFCFSAICLIEIVKEKKSKFSTGYYVLSLITLTLSLSTLVEYIFDINLGIDNILVVDTISKKYPGRMSPATASCFSFLATALVLFRVKNALLKQIRQQLVLFVVGISVFTATTYIVSIPLVHKAIFFKTMAIHTSVFFFVLAAILLFKLPESSLTRLLKQDLPGSKAFRKLLLVLYSVPVLVCILLFYAIKKDIFTSDFALILFAISIVTITVVYVFFLTKQLNTTYEEQNRLELDLRTSNEYLTQYRYAIDAVSIVAVTDPRGVITHVNDHFCKISKYTREELIGKTHKVINSGSHNKLFFRDLWRTISAGKTWEGEIKNRAKDGTYYWVDTVIVPIKNQSGEIDQYISIRNDITPIKKEQLNQKRKIERLEFQNKELEQFTYIASHDLQEPLRTLKSCTGILQEDYYDKLDEDGRASLNFINDASNRMSTLVKGLMDYSRLGVEKVSSKIDLNALLNDVLSDLNQIIDDKEATIKVATLPEIEGYDTELRLLFQNLLNNAIKFSKKDIKPIVVVSAEAREGYWLFSVVDNGIGIEKQYTDRIFNLFQRLHKRKDYEGSGIGLANCSKIVDLHGGKIWVESVFGVGSKFSFTIKRK